jgi:hypothetical protein
MSEKSAKNGRRSFLKTIGATGLTFSGITGVANADADEHREVKHWDVIVIGGGPGGVPAAVAAARNGARVLLVESYGFLGGMATTALVMPYMTYSSGGTYIIRGLFEEFLDLMEENGGLTRIDLSEDAQIRLNTFVTGLDDRAHFDDEPMKRILDRFVLDAGVDLLLHTRAIGVILQGDRIEAVRLFHKGGIEDVSADIIIDSTGDGDIAAWAGAEVEIGRDSDGGCQPMTMSFRMANVDMDRIPDGREFNRLYDAAKRRGDINNPRENVLKFLTVHSGVMHFNSTRVIGESPLDGWSITKAEVEGRQQVDELVRFLGTDVPGFEQAYLMKTGPQIGVRESRRIMGHYTLTADDVISGRKFDDGIACGSYAIDIHNPTGTGTKMVYLDWGVYYQIPYRCLVPRGIRNCIVASRCISATHEAHSSLRVMPTVWAIGQAGGTAAALCAGKQSRLSPTDIDTGSLRKIIEKQNGFLS